MPNLRLQSPFAIKHHTYLLDRVLNCQVSGAALSLAAIPLFQDARSADSMYDDRRHHLNVSDIEVTLLIARLPLGTFYQFGDQNAPRNFE